MTITRFFNLAGSSESDRICKLELEAAGIEVVVLPEIARKGEIATIVMGQIGPWSFQRAWYYWIAKGPGIPPVDAEELYKKHGEEVRVDGHCSCPSPKDLFGGFAVGHYHVDTPRGLMALADVVRSLKK